MKLAGFAPAVWWVAVACTTSSIEPPRQPQDPATIYVADYGPIHTSLILPFDREEGSGRWLEIAFGEWAWFAESKTSWYRVFPTLFWSTPGALGWRIHAIGKGVEQLEAESGAVWLGLIVSAARVEDLIQRFRTEACIQDWMASRSEMELMFNHGLRIVRVERPYHMFNTCNDVVIAWLRGLGCAVTTAPIRLNFEVR